MECQQLMCQLSANSLENTQLKRQLEGHRAGPIPPSPYFSWSQPSPETEQREEQQQEHEALQQRLRLSDKTSSDTAQQKWDEIKREMTERFNQQRREYQEYFSRKNAESMEEYRRKFDTTWHTSLAQEVEKSRKAHEENFLRQAQTYSDALTADSD